jgi:hypothetical protein
MTGVAFLVEMTKLATTLGDIDSGKPPNRIVRRSIKWNSKEKSHL